MKLRWVKESSYLSAYMMGGVRLGEIINRQQHPRYMAAIPIMRYRKKWFRDEALARSWVEGKKTAS